MVLAYHCIFGMYGFWLPNDPRGSGSDYIGSWDLFRYGPATKTRGQQSRAGIEHDHSLRTEAKGALHYPPVILTGRQAVTVVAGFAQAAAEGGYLLHACAVLPDHIHLVVGRHSRRIRQIVGHLKSCATSQLRKASEWQGDERPVWGEHGWNVFLNDLDRVERAIAYVEENPEKEGERRQNRSLVTPFNPTIALATRRTARE